MQLAAFVLIPSDAEFLPIFERLIKPALEQAGYSVSHADSNLHRQSILKVIVRSIAEADLVLADLATLNISLFKELGRSHGRRAPIILISHSIDDVPIDLRPYRVILYDSDLDLAPKLMRVLAEIRTQHVEAAISFGSPVTDHMRPSDNTPGTIRPETPEAPREVLAPPPAEKGVLDLMVERLQTPEVVLKTFEGLSAEIVGFGKRISQHTATIEGMVENPGLVDATSLSKLSTSIAADMHVFAQTLEWRLPALENNVSILEENWTGYFKSFKPESEEETDALRQMRESLCTLHTGMHSWLLTIVANRDGIIRISGMSAEIGTASRRLAHQLDGMAAIIEDVCSFAARTTDLIDEKLAGGPPRIWSS